MKTAIAVVTGCISLVCPRQAIADVFKANNTLDLSDGGSWDGGLVPGWTDTVVWDSRVVGANTVSLSSEAEWGSIRIADPGGPVRINGTGPVSLGSGLGIDMAAAATDLTIAPKVFFDPFQEWNIGTGRTLTLEGGAAQRFLVDDRLRKTGGGSLRLAGGTLEGGIDIYEGRVEATGVDLSSTRFQLGGLFGEGANPTLALGGNQIVASLEVPQGVTGAALALTSTTGSISTLHSGILHSPLTIRRESVSTSGPSLAIRFLESTVPAGTDALELSTSGTPGGVILLSMPNALNFEGNIRVSSGLWGLQSSYLTSYPNSALPDSAMISVENTAGLVLGFASGARETIGGLAGTGMISVSAPTNLTIYTGNVANEGMRVFSGILAGSVSSLTVTGSGSQELGGARIAFTGPTKIEDGRLRLDATTNWASAISFGSGTAPVLDLHASENVTWSLTSGVSGGSGNARISKSGMGTVVLAGSGKTFGGHPSVGLTVGEGRLILSSSFANPVGVLVAPGATFGGVASVGQAVVWTGGEIEAGVKGSGSLTMAGLRFEDAGALRSSPATGTTPLVVSGTLETRGIAGGLEVRMGTVPQTAGTYPIMRFGAWSGSAEEFRLPAPSRTLELQVQDGTLSVNVDFSTNLRWVGQSTEWSSNGLAEKNWRTSGSGAPTDFMYFDEARFDDTAVGTAIEVAHTAVFPARMVFDHSAKDFNLSGVMDIGSGSLEKNGSGTLGIAGEFGFTGGAILNAGTVSITSELSLGTGTRTFNGGRLRMTGANQTWSNPTVVNAGGGTLDVAAGTEVRHVGTLSGAGVLTKAGDGILTLPSSSGVVSSKLAIAGGVLRLSYGAGTVSYTGEISGSGGVLQLVGNGSGGTAGLTLAGKGTFTGETQIYGRRIFLNCAAGNAIGGDIRIMGGNWPYHGLTVSRSEQIADSAVLRFDAISSSYDFRLNGKTETLAGIETADGGAVSSPNAIIENAGVDNGINDSNGMALGQLVVAGSGTYQFHGTLRDQYNASGNNRLAFTKSGSGTQALIGTGITYTGATLINSGRLVLRDATAFASASVTLAGGTLELAGTAGNWTFNRPITGGAGDLVKSGDGTVTLTAAASHTGKTIVNGGTLALGAGGSIPNTSQVVLNGGNFNASALASGYQVSALLGIGSLTGSVTVNGRLAIGNSPGTMNFQNLALGSGATAEFEVTGGGVAADLGNVGGLLNLNGATLTLMQLGTYTPNDKFTLFAYTVGNLLGTFNGLADETEFEAAGGRWKINYDDLAAGLNGGEGDRFVTVTAIPEPGALALLGMSLLTAFRRRRVDG